MRKKITARIYTDIRDYPPILILMTDGVSDPKFHSDVQLNTFEAWQIFWQELREPLQKEQPEKALEEWLDGDGDGDDESVIVRLDKVESNIKSLFITVTIHDAEARRQNFGQVSNAFVRIVNNDTDDEIVRFDLSEDYSTETAIVFGEIYRHNGEWKFRAIGQGYSGGLYALCQQYGVDVR